MSRGLQTADMKGRFPFRRIPAVVAEVSANHGGDYRRALAHIRAAAACGADAVKFQVYTPDTLTFRSRNRHFMIRHPEWGGQSLYDLYAKACTPWSWFRGLKACADRHGITFFATAFDRSSVDLLEELDVPCHKISSFELVDIPLIRYAAGTGKPLILSTGMGSPGEIRDAVRAARAAGAPQVILLKCVSSYPASPAEMNLRTIQDMERRFSCPAGLSDHSLGTGAAVAAVALGARLVEKHFTLSRRFKTADSFFSIEPGELKELVGNVRIAADALGRPAYGLTPGQKYSRRFRRSLFVVKAMKKGDKFSGENVRSIRPAAGMAPKLIGSVIGRKARRAIREGTPLVSGMIG